MTKTEAIDLLDNLIGFVEDSHGNDYDTALKMAIEALTHFNSTSNSIKNELNELSCSEEPNRSDTIYRQDAIDACKHAWAKGLEPSQYIEILPSAQPEDVIRITGHRKFVSEFDFDEDEPERKKGEWIHKPDIYLDEQTWECSECGEPWIFIEGTPSENNANFCPNCGADMRGDNND